MNILVLGKHGLGKSLLGDLLKVAIFKKDSNSTVNIDDKDRQFKSLGTGKTTYNILIRQDAEEEVKQSADVIVEIRTSKFLEVAESLDLY